MIEFEIQQADEKNELDVVVEYFDSQMDNQNQGETINAISTLSQPQELS